jgi:hypothetical protein
MPTRAANEQTGEKSWQNQRGCRMTSDVAELMKWSVNGALGPEVCDTQLIVEFLGH